MTDNYTVDVLVHPMQVGITACKFALSIISQVLCISQFQQHSDPRVLATDFSTTTKKLGKYPTVGTIELELFKVKKKAHSLSGSGLIFKGGEEGEGVSTELTDA